MAEQRLVPLFVFTITFLATFIIIYGNIPSNLRMASQPEYQKTHVPEYFSALDLTQIAWWDNHTIGPDSKFFLPPTNPQIEVWGFWPWPPSEPRTLYFIHVWVSWYMIQSHEITGLEDEGYGFQKQEILEHWDAQKNCSRIDAQCACGTIYYIFITYNATKYSNLAQAIDNQEVEVLIGIGVEDAVAKVNAWNIIGQLLTFQLPDIHPVLNLIIAVPLWAGIAVLAYILILMAIPFVGG